MNVRDVDRDRRIRQMYANGATLQTIGDTFGFGRERARYLVARSASVADHQHRKEAISQARYGCCHAAFVVIGLRAAQAYRAQQRGAAQRGIVWDFNLQSWFAVWGKSGRWHERGRRVGQYVMARIGDVGPYSPGNVEIIPHAQNITDAATNGRVTLFQRAAA